MAVAQPAVAPDDRGDLALAPYYTVRDDWVTGLHIVNTSDKTQVVKVRFRRATDAMDALDFNLVMSPEDVYAGLLSRDANGDIAWASPDTTCTVPAARGRRLEMPAIYRAGAETGYVEIIAMGTPSTERQPIALAAKHRALSPSTTGASTATPTAPLDCDAVRSNFFADGSGTAAGATTRTIRNGVQNNDTTWQAASSAAAIKTGGRNTYLDSGNVLKVSYFIRDKARGIEFGDNAVHIRNFLTAPVITNQQYGVLSGDLNGFDFPDLNGGVPMSSAGGASIKRARFEALRAPGVLGASAIVNEWSAKPAGLSAAAGGVAMDWVLTLPGQYTMLRLPQYVEALIGAGKPWARTTTRSGSAVQNSKCPRSSTSAECDYRDQPVELSVEAYSREESKAGDTTPELVTSPTSPLTLKKTYLPKVANVVTFGGQRVLGISDADIRVNPGQPYGWVRASLKSVDSDVQVCDWDFKADTQNTGFGASAGVALKNTLRCSPVSGGVPVIGFAAWSRQLAANPSASYGRIVEHSYERNRVTSGTVFRDPLKDGGMGPEMVVLPSAPAPTTARSASKPLQAGRFRMGNLSDDVCGPLSACEDERPVRTVTIRRAIAMGKYEVTFADYDRFAEATGRPRPRDWGWGRGARPVIGVSRDDAEAYALWLSAQTGKRYRLPTEAEWEYAARAGTTTRYSRGNRIACSEARYGHRPGGKCGNGLDGPTVVGSFAANRFGLYDMHGNVWEWVEDCYVNTYSGAPSDGSARTTGCGSSPRAVMRGGSWVNYPGWLRSAVRNWSTPSGRYYDLGFRLAQDIGPAPSEPPEPGEPIEPTTPGAPAAPSGLSLTAGNAQVTASWQAVSGLSAAGGRLSYTLYYSKSSLVGVTDLATRAGVTGVPNLTGTSHTVTGLTNGATYYFVVRAVNAVGTSAASAEKSTTPTSTGFRDTLKDGGQAPEMVVLPTGRFRMGNLNSADHHQCVRFLGNDCGERPVRTVTIGKPIAMGKYEVTFADYDRFVAATGRTRPDNDDSGWGRGTRPVINVNRGDAAAYAFWLSTQTGKRYRLPTEAEWEYAARAGTTTRYGWGDSITCTQANYGRNNSGCSLSTNLSLRRTVPVGRYAANLFGLYDMHGNVNEWVADCYGDYADAPTDGSARTCGRSPNATFRGGSWAEPGGDLRSSKRFGNRGWSTRYYTLGFRLVQDLTANLQVTPGNAQVTASWQAAINAGTYNLYYAQESFARLGNSLSGYSTLRGGTRVSNITGASHTVTGLTNGTRYYFVVTVDDASGQEGAASAEVFATPARTFRDTLKDGGQGPEMVVLPTCRFRMGDLSDDVCARRSGCENQRPVRTVTIGKAIAMGKYEVTFADYDRFVAATSRTRPDNDDSGWGRGTRPVINVNRGDAAAYAAWLSAQTGKRYRLPSEAEWEYAARAGTTTRYSWGDSITCTQANYGRNNSGCSLSTNLNLRRTVPVGRYAANPFGLYDMHGNVNEWVQDCYVGTYNGAPTDGSARTCGRSPNATFRGGSWAEFGGELRSSKRFGDRGWSTRYYTLGFRLVQDLTAPTNFQVTASNAEVTASWQAASSGSRYNLYYAQESFARLGNSLSGYSTLRGVTKVSDITGTSHTLTGLTNGTRYYFVVTVDDASGQEGAASSEVSVTPLAPPVTPTRLRLTPGNKEVTASWFSRWDSGLPAAGRRLSYILYYATSSLAGATDLDTRATGITRVRNITGTSTTVTGLTNGTRYYFVVKGINANGESSAASAEASVIPQIPAPTNLSLTAGNTQATASWTAVSGASSYTLYYAESSFAGITDPATKTGVTTVANLTGTSHTVGELTNGATYYFVVRSVNAGGESSAASTETSVTPLAPPGAPSGLSLTAGNAQVTATWTAVSGASSYTLYYAESSLTGATDLDTRTTGITRVANLTGASHTVTGLTNGTTYYFVVRAVNAVGQSPASTEASATPQAPATVTAPAAPSGLSLTAGNTQVTANWQAVTSATRYTLYYSQSSLAGVTNLDTQAGVTGVPNLTGTSHTVTGLTNGTRYYFVVTATNAVGASAASAEKSTTPTSTGFRDTLKDGSQGPEMVVLPTGSFRMGNLSDDVCASTSNCANERPVRTVTISKRIAIGKYEVTFADYDRFADATAGVDRPNDQGWGRGTRPVIYVSQEDAKAYAAWLSAQTSKTYRLPTEAEWEYAARAGTTTRYSWGNSITCSQAHYGHRPPLPFDGVPGGECSSGFLRTVAVGSFAANPFGLYDMHGNVYEWVQDCWHNNYEGAPSDGSAWTTGCVGTRAVVRGGSWDTFPRNLRSAYRLRYWPSTRNFVVGFRLVQDVNP